VPVCQQSINQMRTDKPGATANKHAVYLCH
jgi:hypothetical protein